MKKVLITAAIALTTVGAYASDTSKFAPPNAAEIKITGDAAKGAATYKMFCASCHGATGKGDGAAAAALNPKPRDFADKERMSQIADWEILKVIKDGGASIGLSPLMTPWGAVLQTDEKLQDVAAFVRSLSN
ncbi:MAG: cytochrome c [Kiritimatiellae bacterium]|nr:cytochrome c [Kiritimatiellia bacterium]MCO5062540.1 cytochrome c [Kiritimatiellia bacterium]MCO5068403.1 cytochrome c [Kiritimatiellia bacterium]MCO6400142.1 cytochrome c [Verrucomicrobiota bacterium]